MSVVPGAPGRRPSAAPRATRLPPADQPFDAIARDYDAAFTNTRLGRWLRQRVHRRLAEAFHAGEHVLELGCGTGEDAVWLARRGVRVVATDVSPEMLAVASEKARSEGLSDLILFRPLDLDLAGEGGAGFRDVEPPSGGFDGAFSNFGALNCVPDRRSVAAGLATQLRSGGKLVLVVMGPLCPWEIVGHATAGRFRAAGRRFHQGAQARLGPTASQRVWYPSPRRLRRELDPWFRHLRTAALGLLLPPTDFAGLTDRWPRLFTAAASAEDLLATLGLASWLSDHYVMTLERR